jgi:hypothetical protein
MNQQTYELSPAVSAKGTVKPSANPMIASLMTAPLSIWNSSCGNGANDMLWRSVKVEVVGIERNDALERCSLLSRAGSCGCTGEL